MKQQYEKRINTLQDQSTTATKTAPKAADVEAQIQAVKVHLFILVLLFGVLYLILLLCRITTKQNLKNYKESMN